ncbi:ubiquitin-protein transferase [Stemphylium lycopersici]|uniref:Ubiquitin-protein transferase n=1 Tax=Stemphylium lycopersici TaxID=183478 RepID=A0A364MYX7_STELY|nr:ubiquitin-protein transferase [Stemphylium lycopersici]RAR11010.1 ubiquitin-protein transferase [Stemphylium lycopersici]
MSTNPATSESPSLARATPSPRSRPLEYSEDPPGDEHNDQQPPDDALEDDDIPYPEPSSEQPLLPPPNFRPFFALIEDATSGEHYHPYIHYVFADDDPTIVTAASMRGLGLDDTRYLPQDAPPSGERRRHQGDEQDSPVESPLPPPIPGVKEHYIIVDVAEDGRTIVDAQSLSPGWQITDTGVRTAPSFDEDSPDPGYMLRIEGVEITQKSKGKGKGEAGLSRLNEAREQQGDIFGALDGLVHGIERGLDVAGKISGPRQREGEDGQLADVFEEHVDNTVGDEQ